MADEPENIQDYVLPGPPENNVDYAFSNAMNKNDAALSGNADINDVNNNDVFTYPANMDITKHMDDVQDIVQFHATYLYQKYEILQSYYEGKHYTILNQDANDPGKPDSRKQINLPKTLVNAFNGYDCGNAVQISLASGQDNNDGKTTDTQTTKINGQIDKYLQKQHFWTMSMRLNTMASIYGRSYLYAYYDDFDPTNPTIDMVPCSPLDTIVVYDDTIAHHPMFAIRYSEDENDQFSGTLITRKGEYHFSPTNGVGSAGDVSLDHAKGSGETRIFKKPLPCLPVIEMTENDGRIGIFCDCLSLIDAIDEIESQKENDLLAVSNSYLVIQGVKMTKDQLQQISQTHVINPYPSSELAGIANQNKPTDINVKFLAPQINDNLQEHTLDRDISQVYQTAQVVDLSDPKTVTNAQTATEIHQLYGRMEAKAKSKDAEFDRVLSKLFTLLFAAWGYDTSLVDNLQYHHQLSTPHNDLQEAQAYAQIANTKLPTAIKLSFLPGHINNNKQVANEIDSNNKSQQKSVASQINQSIKPLQDKIKQQMPDNNQGDHDDNQNPDQKQNQPTDNSGQSD